MNCTLKATRASRKWYAVCLACLLAMSAMNLNAQFKIGDVFAGVGNGKVFRYSPTGTLLQTMIGATSGETTGMAFDSAGNLYSTNFSNSQIYQFDINGVKIGTWGSGFNSHPESILINKAGDFYVGQADGSKAILKFSPAGSLLKTITPTKFNRGTDWIDLSADQNTIFYASEGATIFRVDANTGAQLADFTTKGSGQFALRILGDGGVLVANSSNVLRYDSGGNIVKTYTGFTGAGQLFALNLDPDGTSFWTGDIGGSTKIFRVDIATGNILTSWAANKDGATEVAGLAVFGEITVGGGGTPPVPVPPSLILMITGLGFGGAAMYGMKKRFSRR